jgi:hypothetical protein
MLTIEERRKREETAMRTRRNARPAVCNRVTNKRTEDDATYTTSGPGLILPLLYPEGVKPSAVLRAVRREAERLGVSLMPVEMGAGTYNGAGALRGKELPSAFQAVGEWDDVLALSRHWAFFDYGTTHGPALPLNARAPRGTRDEVCPHSKIGGEGISERVVQSIRERVRPKEEREAREKRAELNKVRETSAKSVYHADAVRVAEGHARTFLSVMFDTAGMSQDAVDHTHRLLTNFYVKHNRAPASQEELYSAK